MRSLSTKAFGQPSDTKPTLGAVAFFPWLLLVSVLSAAEGEVFVIGWASSPDCNRAQSRQLRIGRRNGL
jgi:hypothetical protein